MESVYMSNATKHLRSVRLVLTSLRVYMFSVGSWAPRRECGALCTSVWGTALSCASSSAFTPSYHTYFSYYIYRECVVKRSHQLAGSAQAGCVPFLSACIICAHIILYLCLCAFHVWRKLLLCPHHTRTLVVGAQREHYIVCVAQLSDCGAAIK